MINRGRNKHPGLTSENIEPLSLVHYKTVPTPLESCIHQSHPLAGNSGESKEVLGFHGNPVYHTLGDLLFLRRDPQELGVVDSTASVFDSHGRNW